MQLFHDSMHIILHNLYTSLSIHAYPIPDFSPFCWFWKRPIFDSGSFDSGSVKSLHSGNRGLIQTINLNVFILSIILFPA